MLRSFHYKAAMTAIFRLQIIQFKKYKLPESFNEKFWAIWTHPFTTLWCKSFKKADRVECVLFLNDSMKINISLTNLVALLCCFKKCHTCHSKSGAILPVHIVCYIDRKSYSIIINLNTRYVRSRKNNLFSSVGVWRQLTLCSSPWMISLNENNGRFIKVSWLPPEVRT